MMRHRLLQLLLMLAVALSARSQSVEVVQQGVHYWCYANGTALVTSPAPGPGADTIVVPATVTTPAGTVHRVTIVGRDTFCADTALVHLELPEGVEVIYTGSICRNPKLQSVKLPSTLTNMHDSTMSYNPMLKWGVLPEGMSRVGVEVLSHNSGMTYVELKGNVRSLYASLVDLPKLEMLVLRNTMQPPMQAGGGESGYECGLARTPVENALLLVPPGSEDAYLADPEWSRFAQVMTLGF